MRKSDMPTKPSITAVEVEWKREEAVKKAETYWKHQDIVGLVCQEQLGLGNYNAKRWSKAS